MLVAFRAINPTLAFFGHVEKHLQILVKQTVSPRPASGIRNHPVPSFCPPIVIPNLMMSLPGPPARAEIFDNPGWNHCWNENLYLSKCEYEKKLCHCKLVLTAVSFLLQERALI